jgi:hypothetical protein
MRSLFILKVVLYPISVIESEEFYILQINVTISTDICRFLSIEDS